MVSWLVGAGLVGACAAPPPPPRLRPPPPVVEPRPPRPPPRPAWHAPVDPDAQAEYARLQACSREKVDAFNDMEETDDAATERAATLLREAAACFESAGRWANTVQVLRVLKERYPEHAETADIDYRVRKAYEGFMHPLWGADTPAGKSCGATAFDPPAEAEPPALIPIAECLEEAGQMGMALRYRQLASERGADRRNAEAIERLEEYIARTRERLLDM